MIAPVSADAQELRLGLITPPNHVWSTSAAAFGEELSERTDGRMSVQACPGSAHVARIIRSDVAQDPQ